MESINDSKYTLIEMVDYNCEMSENDVGHYRAFNRIANNTWHELDDNGNKVQLKYSNTF